MPGAPEPEPEPAGFATLGLDRRLVGALTALGYEEPTPIQREAIPVLLAGHDLIGQAATGTGKTAAFALPVVAAVTRAIDEDPSAAHPEAPVALVLAPTRELATQVSEAIYKYGRHAEVRVLPVYGGADIVRQLQALRRGVHVVVGTPGRVLDHLRRGSLRLDQLSTVILDEADEMLDMGFADELDEILASLPDQRQTVLFSATMPPRIDAIARRHLTDPVNVRIKASRTEAGESPLVSQRVYVVRRAHKSAALGRILDVESPSATLVFCRTRSEVDQLTETLNGRGYRAEALHGGMDQVQRERVMGRLKTGTADLLVATDVAARGIDVDTLTHVVNYDVPSAPEAYVHRIGRVGRAGRTGVAITLAEPRELRLLQNIERLTRTEIGTATVPTVEELRVRRRERTIETLRAALDRDDLGELRPVLDALLEDHDAEAVALAALRLVHDAEGDAEDEVDIPDATPRRDERGGRGDRGGKRDDRRGGAPDRGGRSARGDRGGKRDELSSRVRTGKVYVSSGREDRVRPQDLVGAIANETGLSGRDIGTIKVHDHYSIVEVPETAVDEVIGALSTTSLRGRKVNARRYTENRR